MRSNLDWIPELPKSKKGLYFSVKEKFKVGCVCSLKGSRRVGKSTLLKQLCEELDGYYFDVEKYLCSYNSTENVPLIVEDFKEIWSDSSVKFIAIDEITKVPASVLGTLIEAIKTSFNKGIVYTGSIPSSVEIVDKYVMPNYEFTLYPLNYVEYCDWNAVEVGLESYQDYLTFSNSLQYFHTLGEEAIEENDKVLQTGLFGKLRVQNDEADTDSMTGLKSLTLDVLDCCIASINKNYNENSDFPVSSFKSMLEEPKTTQFEKMLLGTIFSGGFNFNRTDHFKEMPSLSLSLNSSKEYLKLKDFIAGNKKMVEKFKRFLIDSGLAEEYYSWCFKDSRGGAMGLGLTDYCKVQSNELLFWYLCFTNAVTNKDQYNYCSDAWIEKELSRQACILLRDRNFGKFRDNDNEELDIVSDYLAIEVKNAPFRKFNYRIPKYCNLCERIGIESLIITCNDSEYLNHYSRGEVNGVKTLVVNNADLSCGLGLISFSEATKSNFIRKPFETLIRVMELEEIANDKFAKD